MELRLGLDLEVVEVAHKESVWRKNTQVPEFRMVAYRYEYRSNLPQGLNSQQIRSYPR